MTPHGDDRKPVAYDWETSTSTCSAAGATGHGPEALQLLADAMRDIGSTVGTVKIRPVMGGEARLYARIEIEDGVTAVQMARYGELVTGG